MKAVAVYVAFALDLEPFRLGLEMPNILGIESRDLGVRQSGADQYRVFGDLV
jgi:hypothetical protein